MGTTPGPNGEANRIPRPRVMVEPDPIQAGRHNAACFHCTWHYSNVVKSDVEYMATRHRADHREGRI